MYTERDILGKLNSTNQADRDFVCRAYQYAQKAHEGHTRYSGEPYMTHLAAVAYSLATMGMGPKTISAGLLHDTVEDTPITSEDIAKEFGDEILFLVEGVTKLSSVRYRGTDRHNESLRKLFVATSQDIRVLIIKLNDRLHNMTTLHHVKPEKQLRIARETLEIYVPVAHRLGMRKIRKELEDLAFPFVYPEEAKHVQEILAGKYGKSEIALEKERKILQKRLAEIGVLDFHTSFRVKGIYSMFHKLKRKDWEDTAILDLLAMRVVVSSVDDCSRVLGIIHELWRPLPGRVKDYIAFHKPNGYQSLHTTITTQNGVILEIQIRTEQMHHEAEYGVASHMIYKNKQGQEKQSTREESTFARLIPRLFRPFSRDQTPEVANVEKTTSIPHEQKIPGWIAQIGKTYTPTDTSTSQFIEDAESDFFSNRIFVFTPTGDVVDLPTGATPIDFAFSIHSDIGEKMASAKVNRKMAQLDVVLHNGDIVEIETRKTAHPTEKWLQAAKTSVAKRKIRSWLDRNKESTR
jgi:guanosine-3',5'-bis(diphosphate) 3'-pyrophosphohydrolase